jgi:hypothetical protein
MPPGLSGLTLTGSSGAWTTGKSWFAVGPVSQA